MLCVVWLQISAVIATVRRSCASRSAPTWTAPASSAPVGQDTWWTKTTPSPARVHTHTPLFIELMLKLLHSDGYKCHSNKISSFKVKRKTWKKKPYLPLSFSTHRYNSRSPFQTSMSAMFSAPVLNSVRTPRVATTASVPPATEKWVTATCARLRVRTIFSWAYV